MGFFAAAFRPFVGGDAATAAAGGADSALAPASPIVAGMAAFFAAPPATIVLRTRSAKPRKPNSWNSSSNRWPSQSRRFQVSQSSASGTRVSSVTSFLLRSRLPFSTAAFSAARVFGPPGSSSAWAITSARVPYCWSHFAAVFGPTPGTPGTLSTESPTSAWKSMTCSGRTPQSFTSASASSSSCLRRLRIFTRRDRHWRRSLSDEQT